MYKEYVEDCFYAALLHEYPGLKKSPEYLRLMQILLWGTWRDDKTGGVIISQEMLAACENKEDQLVSRHYCGERLLEAYRRDVDPLFDWIEWAPLTRCRVTRWTPSPALHVALEREIQGDYLASSKVSLFTGRKSSAMVASRDLADRRKRAQQKTALHPPEEKGQRILEYNWTLSARHYSGIRHNLPAAYAWIAGLQSEEKRRYWSSILGAVQDHLVPVLSSSPKTSRLAPLGVSIGGLCSDLRRILCPDWVELDISNCVVACVAKFWSAKKVQKYLSKGKDFWLELCHTLGIYQDYVDFSSVRKAIKKAIVSALFLSGKKTWQEELAQSIPSVQDPGNRLLAHPLVKNLLRARSRKLKEIRAAGGAQTLSGKHLALVVRHRFSQKKGRVVKVSNAPSILAQLTHEIELEIVESAYEFVTGRNDCWILNYQFDGFSLAFRDQSRAKRLTEMLIRHVQRKIDDMGVCTRLKIDYCPWMPRKQQSKPETAVPPVGVQELRQDPHQEHPEEMTITPSTPVELRQEVHAGQPDDHQEDADGWILTDDPDDLRFFDPACKIKLRAPEKTTSTAGWYRQGNDSRGEHQYGYRRFHQAHVAE